MISFFLAGFQYVRHVFQIIESNIRQEGYCLWWQTSFEVKKTAKLLNKLNMWFTTRIWGYKSINPARVSCLRLQLCETSHKPAVLRLELSNWTEFTPQTTNETPDITVSRLQLFSHASASRKCFERLYFHRWSFFHYNKVIRRGSVEIYWSLGSALFKTKTHCPEELEK